MGLKLSHVSEKGSCYLCVIVKIDAQIFFVPNQVPGEVCSHKTMWEVTY